DEAFAGRLSDNTGTDDINAFHALVPSRLIRLANGCCTALMAIHRLLLRLYFAHLQIQLILGEWVMPGAFRNPDNLAMRGRVSSREVVLGNMSVTVAPEFLKERLSPPIGRRHEL